MAVVQLADIYEPTIFNAGVQEAAVEQNAFLRSGIMVSDPVIDNMASGPGTIGEIPFFYGLTHDEPDYVTDDPTDLATPAKLSGAKQVYRKANLHKSWSTMDLARELGLIDPLGAITGRIGKYWAVNTEKRLIQTALGVLADNIANDSGDMVNAVHTETGASAVAANRISAEAVLDATQTMGDHARNIGAIAMHSIQYNQLRKANLIDYVAPSDAKVRIPMYLDMEVIVDDSMPVRAGTTNGFVYTVILFAKGAFAYGKGTPPVPSEIERVANAGYGGGQDIIHSRTTEIVHPYGLQWLDASVAGQSATYTELATAANWNRIYASRKNLGMAFLTVN